MITRGLIAASLGAVLAAAAAAASADIGGVHAEVSRGALETPAPDHMQVWCNSPQTSLTVDNGNHAGFVGLSATWQNLMAGAFVATPEGVVIGSSRDGSALKTSVTVQPRERQRWTLHPNTRDNYRFAVIGDTRNAVTGSQIFGRLSKDMARGQVQFAIHLGNAVSRGNSSQLQLFREQLRSFPFPTYVVPGNEDVTDGGRKTWRKLFGDVPLEFNIGKDHFLLVDNAFGKVDKPTLSWLESTLKQANDDHARHIFVFLHQPLVDVRPGLNQGMRDVDQVRELLRIFQAHRVHTVFAGHIPLYARETRRGVFYVTTGGGGEKLAAHAGNGAFHHYVRVEVNGDDVRMEPVATPR